MATLPSGRSLVLDTLRTIRQRFNDGRPWTTHELWEHLQPRYRYPMATSRLADVLDTLADLGLVTRLDGDGGNDLTGFSLWRIGEYWRPPPPPEGGGGGPGEPGVPGGGEGDGGAGGIREVLAHPVLFALPPADFDALLDGLFEQVQP